MPQLIGTGGCRQAAIKLMQTTELLLLRILNAALLSIVMLPNAGGKLQRGHVLHGKVAVPCLLDFLVAPGEVVVGSMRCSATAALLEFVINNPENCRLLVGQEER